MSVQITTQETAALTHDASAADVQTALEALVGAGNVSVVKDDWEYTITFIGDLQGIDIPPVRVRHTFVGSHRVNVDVTYKQVGGNGENTIQRVTINGNPRGGHFWITYTSLQGYYPELAVAIAYFGNRLRKDPVLTTIIEPEHIQHAASLATTTGEAPYPSVMLLYQESGSTNVVSLGGRIQWATTSITTRIVFEGMRASRTMQLLQQRVREVMHATEGDVLDGYVISCIEESQSLYYTEEDDAQYTHLVSQFALTVQQGHKRYR